MALRAGSHDAHGIFSWHCGIKAYDEAFATRAYSERYSSV